MPRLSLYKPERGPDYEFLDKQIYEMFTVGGVDMFVHKLLGTKTNLDADFTNPNSTDEGITDPLNIQDLLFLENRDRSYEKDIYNIRCVFNSVDLDFDLKQFGLFLTNDTLFLTVHIRSLVKTLGRKIISGDVIELPNLRDEYALNDSEFALKRFYVVEDVSRASQGFTQTWYPHLYRLKIKRIYDSQEYKDIFNIDPDSDGNPYPSIGENNAGSTLSTDLSINDLIVQEAEENALLSGYDTTHFFTVTVDENGDIELIDTDNDGILDTMSPTPKKSGYAGYLLGDGFPPNGAPFGLGKYFPVNSDEGDYFLRTDFLPRRLFRYSGNRWEVVEDEVRLTLTNTNTRNTHKTGFINNTKTDIIAGDEVEERQSLSKALRPKSD